MTRNMPDKKVCTVDEKNIHSHLDVPDGGLTAWLTVFGAQVSVVNITVHLN